MICHLTLTQFFTITFYHKAILSAIEKAAIVFTYSSLLSLFISYILLRNLQLL